MGHNGDKDVHAKSGGQSLLAELSEMRRTTTFLLSQDEKMTGQIEKLEKQIEELEKQIEEHQKQIEEHQKEITSSKSHVGRLTESSESYLSIRRRFLAIYKRDVKGEEVLQGSEAIREGNVRVYEGDALGDAILFDRDRRSDRTLYRELYELDHTQVLEFCTDQNRLLR